MESYNTPSPISRPVQMKWVLALIFILSIVVVFGVADSGNATAYGLANLATSSPISPMPNPALAKLESVDPKQGANSVVVYVNVYGRNLPEGGKLYLRYSANQAPAGNAVEHSLIPINMRFVDSTKMVARVPAMVSGQPLKPGYYDFVLMHNERYASLEKAYRVFDPQNVDDLYAEPYHLNTVPSQLWMGEETQLTLKVHRLGGQGGSGPFNVDFYLNSVAPENRIGRARVPGISPNGWAYSSMVSWTPQTYGQVKIVTVIDAENAFGETNEENNTLIAERRISIVQADDTYPPVVSSLQVNGGVDEVHQQQINLFAMLEDGTDPKNPNAYVSGPARIYYVELHWYSSVGNGAGSWIPVNWTEWLPYDAVPDEFVLHPTPGMRYIQAWGADAAGNISRLPDSRDLNFIPAEDEVAAGEIRVYRQEANDGQCLRVQLIPLQSDMDADLYIWGPDGTLVGYNLSGAGLTDEVVIQPTQAGVYQIEVEGFTDANYRLDLEVGNTCNAAGNSDDSPYKVPRELPILPVDDVPGLGDAPMPQAELGTLFVFLPVLITGDEIQTTPQGQESIYLPMLMVQ